MVSTISSESLRLAGRSITLDELVALNDEMLALVRAGVPLESGLRALSSDLPGRLGALASSLGKRLESGESLVDSLDDPQAGLPRVYQAVVAAGVRSGQLPAALEGISNAARSAAELRRVMIVSLIYPFIVLQIAIGLFAFQANKIMPNMAKMHEDFGFELPWWYGHAVDVGHFHREIVFGFWAVSFILGAVWLYRSYRASSISRRGMRGIPSVSRVLHAGRMATFADVLALMVEQRVPLDEAVVLAGEASNDVVLLKSSGTLAERIRTGQHSATLPSGFPPLLGWLLTSNAQHTHLAKTLRQTADSYRRRALNMSNWLTIYLPIVLSAGVGGFIAFMYVMIMMSPFYNLLNQLSLP